MLFEKSMKQMLFWRLGYTGEKLGHTPYAIESHTFKLHKKTRGILGT